jgi:hypothetical protein
MKYRVVVTVMAIAGVILSTGLYDNTLAKINTDISSEKLKSGAVYSVVKYGAVLFDDIDGEAVGFIPSGGKVELLKDRGCLWYYIRYNNRLGWVKGNTLHIPQESVVNTELLSRRYIEDFAGRHFTTDTKHFVWVDIDRQKVYILLKADDGYRFEREISCSTGKNQSPTTRGFFKIGDRGEQFYSERLGSGAKYWVRFNGSYLFHSVATDRQGKIVDNTLGKKASSGCVRMSMEDARWFYDNVERGSGVWVY